MQILYNSLTSWVSSGGIVIIGGGGAPGCIPGLSMADQWNVDRVGTSNAA